MTPSKFKLNKDDNRCAYTRGMCTQKMRALSYIGAEKITFPPKPDIQTDIHTYI